MRRGRQCGRPLLIAVVLLCVTARSLHWLLDEVARSLGIDWAGPLTN